MTTEAPPQWLSYLADVAHDGTTAKDAERPRLTCTVLAGTQQGLERGVVLWVCLPREAPRMTTLADRAHAWFSPGVQWAATLVVTEVGGGWAHCQARALNEDLPEMDFGVVGGMRVYVPRWEESAT